VGLGELRPWLTARVELSVGPPFCIIDGSTPRARARTRQEGVPVNVIQRQLGHANLGTTSIYLQGIDPEAIIATVHMRRAPMMSVMWRATALNDARRRERHGAPAARSGGERANATVHKSGPPPQRGHGLRPPDTLASCDERKPGQTGS
jgi:integrase/recombinase XerD